ncbi:Proline-serine-threonine phosphatase-interacting protein 2 [Podila epigama]|nr:Proline-serine-threonine phosphatase-interacting protein 2 [Podila epigama]
MNTERPIGAEEEFLPRFSRNFWGKDDAGYSALTTRMRHAKTTCQEILGMFQARAALEEEYGKKLLKLSKSPLGKDELGSLRDSLDVVRYEIEATGKSHIELSSKMRDQLENALAEFNNAQKDKRKLAREKYEAECLRTKGLSAAKMTLVGKEFDKMSLKMEKTELASRAADVEYQASIRQLTDINDKWINEWRAACDKFQLLEEQRIEYVRTSLWNYANIISSACVADDENLQSFIEAHATGEETPDIPTYLSAQFKTAPGNNVIDNAHSAKTQMHDTKTRTVSGPHQPIPEYEASALTTRRSSQHASSDGVDFIADTESTAHVQPIDVALTVGNNVFKLDPHAINMLNQPEGVRPQGGLLSSANQNDRPQETASKTSKSSAENTLGISLDVTGSVKEDRFPHWQSQAQRPNLGTISSSHPGGQGHHQYAYTEKPWSADQVQVPHSRSQTMPIPNDTTYQYVPPSEIVHRRSVSGAHADDSLSYYHQQSSHQVHTRKTDTSLPLAAATVETSLHDGKPILFYVRAIYDYEATIPEELSLKEGDTLAVLHTRDDGWWEGDLLTEYPGLQRGLFPSNFTEPIM